MNPCVSAIILAAGRSRRMGRQPKPLLPLGDTTILERAIALFQHAGVEEVQVVVGHRHTELLHLIANRAVVPVYNAEYQKGMFSSVISGLRSLGSKSQATFILPVDTPLVRSATIDRMLRAQRDNLSKIVRPTFAGRRGHPSLIPSRFYRSIISWSGPNGLRGALAQFEADTVQVDVPDCHIHFDIDTQEDYRRLLLKWNHQIRA